MLKIMTTMIIRQPKYYGFTFLQIALSLESEFKKFDFFRWEHDRFNPEALRLRTLTEHTERFINQQLDPFYSTPDPEDYDGDGLKEGCLTTLDNLVAEYYQYRYWEGLEIY